MTDSTDLAQVLHEAKDIAQLVPQKFSSAHVLLALFTVDNPAQLLLKEKGINEDLLLELIKEPLSEEEPLVRELFQRARETAEQCFARETNCLHLLIAITRMRTRCAATDLLTRAGMDLLSLRNLALSYFTSGRMPRKLQSVTRTQTLSPRNPLGRPLGAPPTPLPSSAVAVSVPRAVPTPSPASPSSPVLSPRDLGNAVQEHTFKPTAPPPEQAHLPLPSGVESSKPNAKEAEAPLAYYENRSAAPSKWAQENDSIRSHASRGSTPERIDVLIITAIKDEYDAILRVGNDALTERWVVQPGPTGLDVAFREFTTQAGGKLRVAATRALDMGSTATATAAGPLIHLYRPRCIAMSGVCAGRKGYVEQGDVIIASRLWAYDTGKITVEIDETGNRVDRLQGEVLSYNLSATWQQKAESFSPASEAPWLSERPRTYTAQIDWILERLLNGEAPAKHPDRKTKCADYSKAIDLLWGKGWLRQGTHDLTEQGRAHIQSQILRYPDGLPEPPPFQVHVGAIGTGSRVMRDPGIFNRLAETERKLLGLEMEASAVGEIAHLHGVRYALVVKGVMDFADFDKDDHFKTFAARASAECLLGFLRENLPSREETISEQNAPQRTS